MSHRATVAIVGAGVLGGATAHALAARYGVREVRLVDDAASVAAGKALDIQQAGAVERFDTIVSADNDLRRVMGASIVVLADPIDGVLGKTDGLTILRRISALNPHALLVCAGASHREIVQAGLGSAAIPPRRLIGSAPLAFSGAVRAIVGLELRCSPHDVTVSVLGVPPAHLVVPWSVALVEGVPITRRLDPPRLNRLQRKVPPLWPPGPYALASAAAALCQGWLVGTTRRVACFAGLESEQGDRPRAVAVEARLDETGLAEIVEPMLSSQEAVQLESALRTA